MTLHKTNSCLNETYVSWHRKRGVQRLAELLRRRRCDRLILSRLKEATSELRRLLEAGDALGVLLCCRWPATQASDGPS